MRVTHFAHLYPYFPGDGDRILAVAHLTDHLETSGFEKAGQAGSEERVVVYQ
jgi:hypothetical protein